MSRKRTRASVAAAMVFVLCGCAAALAGEVVSTMRNVNAVPEAHGFRLNPAFDMVGVRGPDEKGEPQAFEILRPLDQGVTLGRIYTSCTCIQLVAPKRTYAPGERAVLHLRNVRETPVNGQIYAIYVQISAPIRTTLRFDTFVQSNSLINPDPAAEEDGAEGEGEAEAEAEAEGAAGAAGENDEAEAVAATAETPPALTAEELPEIAGIEIIVPGGETEAPATAATAAAAAEATAEVAATEAAAAAEADVAAANAALATAREELAAIMSTRSEDLAASPAGDAVRDEIDSFFAAGTGEPRAAAAAPAPAARPADSGWQVVAAAPAPAAAGAAATEASARPEAVRAVSLITIGVRDMARAAAFYEAIGWKRAARSKYDAAAFFQLHGQVLALYPMADMLGEQGMADARPAPGGITLALHVATPEEARAEFDRFVAAGGTALKEPAALPGGGVTGYVADPDGNPWEISCVPQFVLDGEGGLWLR